MSSFSVLGILDCLERVAGNVLPCTLGVDREQPDFAVRKPVVVDDADTAALPATLTLPAHFPAVSLEASCSTIELHSLLPRIMLKPCAIGKNLLYTNQ